MVGFEEGSPISRNAVERFQEDVGVILPESYVSVVLEHDGARLEPCSFLIHDPETGRQEWRSCDSLVSFSYLSEEGWHMNAVNGGLLDWLPEGIIIFGQDAGGILIGFDYRAAPDADNPPVVLVDMENDDENLVIRVAESFDGFLACLVEEPDAHPY